MEQEAGGALAQGHILFCNPRPVCAERGLAAAASGRRDCLARGGLVSQEALYGVGPWLSLRGGFEACILGDSSASLSPPGDEKMNA